jgi:hypothetical protein
VNRIRSWLDRRRSQPAIRAAAPASQLPSWSHEAVPPQRLVDPIGAVLAADQTWVDRQVSGICRATADDERQWQPSRPDTN